MNKASMLIAALAFLSGMGVYSMVGGQATSQSQGVTATQASSTNGGNANVQTAAPTITPDLKLASNTQFGTIVVDKDGRSLYAFGKDTGSTSTCYDTCATAWPPVTVDAIANAGEGIDGSLITLHTRKDGTKQVVLNGRPLYRFAQDTAPGDTKGQANKNVWWLVKADGSLIKGTPAGASSSANQTVATTAAPAATSGGSYSSGGSGGYTY